MSASNSSGPSSSLTPTVQEYNIRVPKNFQKGFHIMRFNGNLDVDFSKWSQVKMKRENNMKEFKGIEEELPKYGAGSEFGREAREEARRKKLGILQKQYKPDDQPWILSSATKKFKGNREGGVSENAAHYVFTHAADGAIEAFPLKEWYKFQPIQRYKALSSEEAEEEFSKRNKRLNYFSLMTKKRLKGDADDDLEDGEEGKRSSNKKSKDFKISELEEWMDSSEEESSEHENNDDDEEKEEKKKKKKKKAAVEQKKKKRNTDEEAVEESDDGDDEGRELDYITDSDDESEPENINLAGVSEEKALRKLLNSDEEDSDDEENKAEKEQSNEEEDKDKSEEKTDGDKNKDKKKKKSQKGKDKKDTKNDPNSDFSSDSSTDEDVKKQKISKKMKKEQVESAESSRSTTPTDNKRKLVSDALAGPSAKKPKLDPPVNFAAASETGITEEAVRKYLMRKPITPTELLSKFKLKRSGEHRRNQLLNTMTQILKKVNPIKQTVKGKMYLFLKS